jgi:hypothetical protein
LFLLRFSVSPLRRKEGAPKMTHDADHSARANDLDPERLDKDASRHRAWADKVRRLRTRIINAIARKSHFESIILDDEIMALQQSLVKDPPELRTVIHEIIANEFPWLNKLIGRRAQRVADLQLLVMELDCVVLNKSLSGSPCLS